MKNLFSIPFLIFLFSCNNSYENASTVVKEIQNQPPTSKLNEDGTMKMVNVLIKYYDLKNALVKTDAIEATIAAEKLTLITTDAQVFSASDSVVNSFIGLNLDSIKNASLDISSLSPSDMELMRAKFETISNNLYSILKKVELKNANVYHEFCPMAFSNKGAFWLSEESDVKNPYFGSKMLSCGKVFDSLK